MEVTLEDAKDISKTLRLPLVVILKQYCNLDEEDVEVTDLFYWQDRESPA
jgi:hypothetical protein